MRRSASTSVRFSTSGRSVCLREKASSCRTSEAARLAFCLMFMMSGKDGSDGRWLVEQQVGRHDDGGQHVVEVVRDAAGKLADRLHLLALRHLALERLLLGRLDGIDDRRLFGALAAGAVGDRH